MSSNLGKHLSDGSWGRTTSWRLGRWHHLKIAASPAAYPSACTARQASAAISIGPAHNMQAPVDKRDQLFKWSRIAVRRMVIQYLYLCLYTYVYTYVYIIYIYICVSTWCVCMYV